MEFDKFDICQQNTTNKYETLVGALNIAPTKISGQYKIVIDKNLQLWLDDYCGRKVALDLNVSFLEQVANFLQVKTNIINTDKLRYGGFQESTQKSWHIPIYFGCNINEEFPKYFVLNRVPNENLNHHSIVDISYINPENIILENETVEASNDIAQQAYEMCFPFRYGEIIKIIDLEQIGLYKIFNEINNEEYFVYPLYFDWDNQKINIFGYGINEGYPKTITINLSKIVSNQAYFENLNNKILNSFVENNLFYPRFLNIEFEFDFEDTLNLFNNFMGYLAKNVKFQEGKKPIESNSETSRLENWNGLNPQHLYIKTDNTNYEQISWQLGNYDLNKYLVQIAVGTIGEIHERPATYRFQTITLNIDDVIRIYHPENIYQDFEYVVDATDIHKDLFDSWKALCKKLTKLSKREYNFSCIKSNQIIIVTIETEFDSEECIVELPLQYKPLNRINGLENYNKFRGITNYDVWLVGQPNLSNIGDTIFIEEEEYNIVDKFYITDDQQKTYSIIRLDKPVNIKYVTICRMFDTHIEHVCRLDPINFLKYYSQIPSTQQSNIKEYSKELFKKYKKHKNKDTNLIETNTIFLKALSNFTGISLNELTNNINSSDDKIDKLFDNIITFDNNINQYVLRNSENKLIDSDKIDINYVNEDIIKSMIFCSMGNTTYFTPNILNISEQFWNTNGNIDFNKEENNNLKFSWFLLNGTPPEYCKDSWRYMEKIIEKDENNFDIIKIRPKITSRLIKITDSLCETIFLGVKYHLPIQYENYQFAVYLNYNNQKNIKNQYFIELYPDENLILLSLNYYLDFNDLIRGCDEENEPIVDLSLFYNAHSSMNNSSSIYNIFQDSNLLLKPFYNSSKTYTLKNVARKDWIVNVGTTSKPDYRICIRSKGTKQDLREVFTDEYKVFYNYCKIEYDGEEYVYPSMEIKFEGVSDVFIDYFWCKDIKVKFFDSKNIFLRKLDEKSNLGEDYYLPEYMEKILMIDKNKKILEYYPSENKGNLYSNYHKRAIILIENKDYNYLEEFELLLPDKTLSFKEDWFRFEKHIEPDKIDGEKSITIISTEFLNGQSSTSSIYYQSIIQQLKNNETIYEGSVNLFERNQVWKFLQDIIENDIKFKEMTEQQLEDYFDEFTINNFTNNNIQIINRKDNYLEYIDKYIPINIIPINKNYVIWKPKIYYINRFQAPYIPYLPIEKDYFKFQIKKFQKYDTIWNLYDNKFGGQMVNGTNISATTLYQEVVGNIISTLFCKSDDITLVTNFNQEVNYRKLLKEIVDYDKCIINNDNSEYITSLNKNQKEYIIEKFTDFLLQNFYKLFEVKNELGTRLNYSIDKKDKYNLLFPDKLTLGYRYYNFNNIIIILRRI